MIAAQSGTGHVFAQMSKLKWKSELESYSYFQLLHCTFQEVLYQASEFVDLNINSGLNFKKHEFLKNNIVKGYNVDDNVGDIESFLLNVGDIFQMLETEFGIF